MTGGHGGRAAVRVRPLDDATRAVVTTLVGTTFAEDPVFTALVPDADDRRATTTSLYARELDDPARAVDVALEPDGPDGDVVLGAALWSRSAGRTRRRSAADVAAAASELVHLVRDLGPTGAQRLRRHDAAVEQHRPIGAHWYLEALAVSPVARGRGVGSALLEHRLAEVDASGEVAFLEATTRASLRLYERHSFVLVADVRSPLGVTVHAALRPAQR